MTVTKQKPAILVNDVFGVRKLVIPELSFFSMQAQQRQQQQQEQSPLPQFHHLTRIKITTKMDGNMMTIKMIMSKTFARSLTRTLTVGAQISTRCIISFITTKTNQISRIYRIDMGNIRRNRPSLLIIVIIK